MFDTHDFFRIVQTSDAYKMNQLSAEQQLIKNAVSNIIHGDKWCLGSCGASLIHLQNSSVIEFILNVNMITLRNIAVYSCTND